MAIVLVVDDSKLYRLQIGDTMRELGHEVIEAADGAEALQSIETRRPDVVTLDLSMPNVDGFEVLEKLATHESPQPVVVHSGETARGVRERCLELGARDMLEKPASASALAASVERALRSEA